MGATLDLLGRRALRALGAAVPPAGGGVTVLGYHLVGGGTGSPVDVPSERFREQLDLLAESGRVIPLERALERLAEDDTDEHFLVLTFDDAFRNFYDVAWPLLAERGLPATLYVPCGFVDGSTPAPLRGAEGLPPMSWSQVREIAEAPLGSVGSHTLTHPDLRHLSEAACRAELAGSRRLIERRCGTPVGSFCYPRALVSARVASQVAAIYDSAVAAGGRRNRPRTFDPHRISRLPVRHDMPADLVALCARPVWLEEWAADQARRLAS